MLNFWNIFLNKNFISDKRAFIGFIISAKAFYYKGKDKESSELFEMARTVAPKEEFSEAHFYLVWPYIVEKDIKGLKKGNRTIKHSQIRKNNKNVSVHQISQFYTAELPGKISVPAINIEVNGKIQRLESVVLEAVAAPNLLVDDQINTRRRAI